MADTTGQGFEEFDQAEPGLWKIQAETGAVEPRAPNEPDAPQSESSSVAVPDEDSDFEEQTPPLQGLSTPTLSAAEYIRDQQNRRDDNARTFILRTLVGLYAVVTVAYFVTGFVGIGDAAPPDPGEAIFTALTGIVGLIVGHYFTSKK